MLLLTYSSLVILFYKQCSWIWTCLIKVLSETLLSLPSRKKWLSWESIMWFNTFEHVFHLLSFCFHSCCVFEVLNVLVGSLCVLSIGTEFFTSCLPRRHSGLTHSLNLSKCTLEAHIFPRLLIDLESHPRQNICCLRTT